MIDICELHYFLCIEVWQKEDNIFMLHAKYTLDILKKFNKMGCKLVTTPLEIRLKLYRMMTPIQLIVLNTIMWLKV